MKRCEEKIRYRTSAGARWALWGIWWDDMVALKDRLWATTLRARGSDYWR